MKPKQLPPLDILVDTSPRQFLKRSVSQIIWLSKPAIVVPGWSAMKGLKSKIIARGFFQHPTDGKSPCGLRVLVVIRGDKEHYKEAGWLALDR